jgi:hypothetical protein
VVCIAACGFSSRAGEPSEEATQDAASPAPTACVTVADGAAVVVATATGADEYALTITAQAASDTAWSAAGNEALVLEVTGAGSRLIGHLVLHQGSARFGYGIHTGALAAGEPIALKVSTLSAAGAVRTACVTAALAAASTLGSAAEGLGNAPIFLWPVGKRFNDVPLVVGWSRATRAYQTVFSNEDGGTVAQCGGGPAGIRAEIARWGRAADIEASYGYAARGQWQRCTGNPASAALRFETSHPILYYGDGHNRLFESRAGYGQACGTATPEKPNGDLDGWNVNNPSNEAGADAGRVVIFRPLPVDLDALGYDLFRGRREALIDSYAPWLYRITALEIQREGRLDDVRSLPMTRYLYADVRVADVDGRGDQYCSSFGVSSGFKLRAVTTSGVELSSPQMTSDYTGTGHDWKRLAIALPANLTAADIALFRFDAYDGDGIYLTAIGDAFLAQPDGGNGARLDYVRRGERVLAQYVDDDYSGCAAGANTAGPGGTAYTCVGGQVDVAK